MNGDALRRRGVEILGALVQGRASAVASARAWECDVLAEYPGLNPIGPMSDEERRFADEHVRLRLPSFSLTTASTYTLEAGNLDAVITTVAVRLHRLQHGHPRRKTGRKPPDVSKHLPYATELRRQPDAPSKSEAARCAVAKFGAAEWASEEAAVKYIREHPQLP